jgi:hypothetical protein
MKLDMIVHAWRDIVANTQGHGEYITYYTWPQINKDNFTYQCTHEVIDNGTRLSECRHCKTTMRLKGFDWSAE